MRQYKVIETAEGVYLAHIPRHQLIQIDALAKDVLELYDSRSAEQIEEILAGKYPVPEIQGCLEELQSFFDGEASQTESSLVQQGRRPKIVAPRLRPQKTEMRWDTLGASVAHTHLLGALSKVAEVHSNQKFEGADIHFVDFQPDDKPSISRFIAENYDGVLLWYVDEFEFLPLLRYLDAPVVLPVYAERGGNGRIINGMLRWYSAMRSFDSFMVLTQSPADFYAKFFHDTSIFSTVPCGVDSTFFSPMDREEAKAKVTEWIGRPEIAEQPIVGYLSRFDTMKGAAIFVDLARLLPDVLFLAVGPIEADEYRFPPNFIHAGRQPRENLPVFYNAFDLFCFPSIAGSETFGLVVLESMACGTVPIVSSFDGPKYVVGDAGVVVKAATFEKDMVTISGYASPHAFAAAVKDLLADDAKRRTLGEKARERSLTYSWEASAACLLEVFEGLNQKRELRHGGNRFPVVFGRNLQRDGATAPKATVVGITRDGKSPMGGRALDLSVEEGIALALSRRHTPHEIEVVLSHLYRDSEKVSQSLQRIHAYVASQLETV
ncbi:MAG: glycosyltransferase family 4 protein [Candidatus Poribacteria bacterium]|nr:glycosyltransferase family 4 protein [Candidatus Poribacteria bacterium]MDE0505358.1 glycosyltransferase family 4 protein [Candidatus Poribacteria bacterium]